MKIRYFSGIVFCIIILSFSTYKTKELPFGTNTKTVWNKLLIIQDTIIESTTENSSDILHIQSPSSLKVILKNNIISVQNKNAHIILLGSENPGPSTEMLNNSIISGNKITWLGNDITDENEGILVGFSTNVTIIYNLLINCPYGTPVKYNGLTNTTGYTAYNIYGNSFKVGAASKGTNGMKFYNNTFYNSRNINIKD